MPRSIQANPNRQSAPMLATFLTLMYGVIGCSFAIVFSSDAPEWHFGIVLTAILAFALLCYLMRRAARDVVQSAATWIMRHRNDDPLADYSPTRKRGGIRQYGTQRPATADEVRQMQADRNVFVPAGSKRQ